MTTLAVSCLLLAACSSGSDAEVAGQPAASGTPAGPAAPLELGPAVRIEPKDAISVSAVLDQDHVFWAGSRESGVTNFDHIARYDLRSKQESIVVQARPGHHIDWLGVDAEWITYRELEQRPSPEQESPRWQVRLRNLATQEDLVLDEGGAADEQMVPTPLVVDGRVSWLRPTEADPARTELRLYTIDRKSTSVLLGPVASITHELTSSTAFVAREGADAGLTAIDLASGKASELLDGTTLTALDADERQLAYAPLEPDSADPSSLHVVDLESGATTRIAGALSGPVSLGAGFVVWGPLGSGTLALADTEAGPEPAPLVLQDQNPNIPAGTSADGDRVLWGESEIIPGSGLPARFTNVLFVAEVPARG